MYVLEQSVSVRDVPELFVGEAERRSNFSAKIHPRFAYHWPDNVKIYTCSKHNCDQNIPCTWFKSLNDHDGRTDARRSIVTVLHTSV